MMPTHWFASVFGWFAANHLWQSTAFAAVAALLALALRANHARARYWLWLAASVKFLIPFSALAAIGSGLGRWFAPTAPVSRVPLVMEQIVQPFTPYQYAPLPVTAAAPAPNIIPAVLLAVWLCGFAAVILYAWLRWRRVAAAVRLATPMAEGREVEALWKKAGQEARPTWRHRFGWGGPPGLPSSLNLVSSTAKLEPGVFGIFRPVLWLPAGIGDHLDDAELEAILAHELCHIRRRDNLLAAVHMLVEALFWFHPLVWWLGVRLEEERERACDEEVVRLGCEPQIYAESILKVVELYLASPVACAAGTTGGELKKRIEGVMTNRFIRELSYAKRAILATTATLCIVGPVAIGLMYPMRGRAQSDTGLRFDVASVKPQVFLPGSFGFTTFRASAIRISGSRITTQGTLTALVLAAYKLRLFQISGASTLPDKEGRDQVYDVEARAPGQGAPTMDQACQMLGALLADRFQLKFHRDMKELPAYYLVVGANPPKLKQSTPDEETKTDVLAASSELMRFKFTNVTMPELVVRIAPQFDRPLFDRTGLAGGYDFVLEYTPPRPGTAGMASEEAAVFARLGPPDEGKSLATALQQQLGLKVAQAREQVEITVIDHAERPSEN